MSIAVEVAVQDEDSLVAAGHAGADRVELCVDLAHGGATPPIALVARCVERAAALVASRDAKPQLDVHVLIRPAAPEEPFLGRPEQFELAAEQVERCAREAAAAIEAGAAGVVIGALARGPRGWELDVPALERIRDAALTAGARALRGVTVTCHRCVDALEGTDERVRATETLLRLGFARVLTSGGAERALDGAEDIARMVEAADDILAVCAGGGVRPADVVPLVRATGVTDIHLSGRPASAPAGARPDPAVLTAAVDAAGAV